MLIDLALGLALWTAFLRQQISIRTSKILISFILLLVVVFIADFFGENFINSFWSNFSRMEGYLALLHYFFYFMLLSIYFDTKLKWQAYFRVLLFVSWIVFVVAVLQRLRFVQAVDFNRVDATFGNSSYLGVYASLHFFLSLFLIFYEEKKIWKIFATLTTVAQILSIYFSQTRSSTVAICLGLLLFIYLASKKRIYVAAGGFVLIGLLGLSVHFLKYSEDFKTNLFARLANISLNDESIKARVSIWRYCFEAIKEKPLLGWGQENFSYLARFYKPDLYSTPWVDRAHNFILDWWVNTGFFGLVAYMVFLLLIVRQLTSSSKSNLNAVQKAILSAFIFCYLINNSFVFDFLSSLIIVYAIFAFIYASDSVQPMKINLNIFKVKRIYLSGFGFMVFLLFIGLSYRINISNLIINFKLRNATDPKTIVNTLNTMPYNSGFEEILNVHDETDSEIRQHLMQVSLYALNQYKTNERMKDYILYIFQLSHSEIAKEIAHDPKNLFFKFNAASYYTQFQDYSNAAKIYEELLSRVPENQYFLIDFGHLKTTLGESREGLRLYQKALDLEPQFHLARMFVAMGLIYNEEYQKAAAMIQSLKDEKHEEVFDERLVNAYFYKKQFESAAALVKFKTDELEKRKR